ncbi:MAG TPA: GtrA family protein [Pseudorhizobium sp.]|nr:GtrA family protein [Pseudorhizobium sp.]
MKRLVWFVVVGGTGFAIDAGLTHLLIAFTAVGPIAARIPAITAAMAVTWLLNRTLTFGRSSSSLVVEGLRYWAVGVTAALLNYAVYTTLIYRLPVQPLAAIIFASLAAMTYSFLGYSRFAFRR